MLVTAGFSSSSCIGMSLAGGQGRSTSTSRPSVPTVPALQTVSTSFDDRHHLDLFGQVAAELLMLRRARHFALSVYWLIGSTMQNKEHVGGSREANLILKCLRAVNASRFGTI
ncbi:hypothetical protein B0T16DRAFT_395493 [Cercophora newfieldiana]|uniref:Uncharacterized protein n=1 Tax=Cercophora newfieldiana TaxID=92897 RepID=A0AA39XVI1_9PEZI|nr:hypothetical protein B0T16DRAFT_395493 [Cercophora newfieldiana]